MATKSSRKLPNHQTVSSTPVEPVTSPRRIPAKTRFRRVLIWIGGILGGLFLLLVAAAGFYAPANLWLFQSRLHFSKDLILLVGYGVSWPKMGHETP